VIDRRGVLEAGKRRRKRRSRVAPVIAAALVTILVVGGVLWLMTTNASGPSLATHASAADAEQALHRPRATPPPAYGTRPAPEQVNVRVKGQLTAGLLFDVRTGDVLWQRSPEKQVAIASLTKMMTALLVATDSKPSDKVLITRAATHFNGSGVGLLPQGKHVPLVPLLYGLLLPSGNDAAIALAQHVAGTEQHFIAMMNDKATQLGLRCTHFNSVSGIVDQDNHSCAAELALIAHLVLKNRLLARIVASRSAILPFPIKGGKLYLYNNNPLLRLNYPGADGVKTGFTDASGPCLVATARRGKTWLGVVLLHSADPSDQAQALLNAGFAKLREHPRT
jgi:serine-type D-Ala-D-Ala carboxypeptidase (penicillin-binding protein 5/6)